MSVIIRLEVIDDETHQVTQTFTEVFPEGVAGPSSIFADDIRLFFKRVFNVLYSPDHIQWRE